MNMLRPISRKYDRAEHEYPKELDMLAAMIDGLSESGAQRGRRRRRRTPRRERRGRRTASRTAPTSPRCCRSPRCAGATSGLLLSMPRQGLGNSAIASVANDEQLERFDGTWAAMAITEPGTGSDSANIHDHRGARTATSTSSTARRSSSPPASAPTASWCGRPSTRASAGRRSSRSWSRRARPGMKVERLEHKLGIRASDTAVIIFTTAGCRRRTCSARPRSTSSRASPARWRPSTTPGRWSPRWPSAAPGRRST